MKTICANCGKVIASNVIQPDTVSHGLCEDCAFCPADCKHSMPGGKYCERWEETLLDLPKGRTIRVYACMTERRKA